MSKALDAVVLIPSLHPDHLLTQYVDALLQEGFHRILVVDDGSGEEYAPLFCAINALPGCEVIGYPVNGGKGHALKHGMRHAQTHYADAPGIVTADADGQHTAPDVLRCAQTMLANPRSLVLGSRDFDTANVPKKSRAGNRLTSFFFALLYGTWLPDTQTGLRAFSAGLVPFLLDVTGDRFEYEMNMLIAASGHHIPFEVITIQTIYIEENRRSHFRPFHDSVRIYRQLFSNFLRYASSSGASTLLDVALFTLMDKWLLPFMGLDPRAMMLWYISWQVVTANLIARAASSVFNYKVNKSLVFRGGDGGGSFVRYAALVLAVLVVSSGLISALHTWLGWDKTLLKIIIDSCLFFANYRLQRSWVFAKGAQKG